MGQASTEKSGSIDFARWRQRIRDDTFSRYHFEMGRVLIDRENDLEAGLGQLRRAVTTDPTFLPAQCALIDSLRGAGMAADAEAAHKAALAVDADYQPMGLCLLALEKIDDGDGKTAEALIVRAEGMAAGRPEITACRRLLELAAGELVDLDAVAGLPVARLASKLADSLDTVGRQLMVTGKRPAAEQAYRWLLALDPEFVTAYDGLCQLLFLRNQHRERAEVAERCIAFAPWNGMSHFHLGNARMVIDQEWGAAHASIQTARCYLPDNQNVMVCDWKIRIAAGNPVDVVPEVRAAITKLPGEVHLKSWLLLALQAAGDVRGAMIVNQSLAKEKRKPTDGCLLALQLAACGQANQGIAFLEGDRPGQPPENPRFRAIWAYLTGLGGRLAPALAEMEKTVPTLADNTLELTCWALLLEAAGDSTRADALYRRAFDTGAKHMWLNTRLLHDQAKRLEATYRRLGLIPHPCWPPAPQTLGASAGPFDSERTDAGR